MEHTYYEINKGVCASVEEMRRDGKLLMLIWDAEALVSCVDAASKFDGDIAEVGCYKGGSASLIAQHKGDKTLHLFDTWDGHPPLVKEDDLGTNMQSQWEGKHKADLTEVQNYLSGFKNINYYKGIFPQTSEPIKNKKFCFVNLDTDLYTSIKAGLEFFYPRMVSGGIITVHDYPLIGGVRRAVDEFKKDKLAIRLSAEQIMFIKI